MMMRILFLVYLTILHSTNGQNYFSVSKKISEETGLLWEATNGEYNFSNCEEDLSHEEKDEPCDDDTSSVETPVEHSRPPFCDNEKTKIPDEEWERPFIKSFTKLLEYYDAIYIRQDEHHEDALINDFLNEFIRTRVGIELYFMINSDWDQFNMGNTKKKKSKCSDNDEEEEVVYGGDEDEDYYKKQTRKRFIEVLINSLEKHPPAEVGRETAWWNSLIDERNLFKEYIDKQSLDPEKRVYSEQFPEYSPPLYAHQRKNFLKRLKQVWFGDASISSKKRKIGFRHVFAGERSKWEKETLSGFHNWYQFYRMVCKKPDPPEYSGIWKKPITKQHYFDYSVQPNKKEQSNWEYYMSRLLPSAAGCTTSIRYCKVKVDWGITPTQYISHKFGSVILFGSQPEYDFAVFTLCFLRWAYTREQPSFMGTCSFQADSDELAEIWVGGRMNGEYETFGDSHLVTAYFK